MTENFKNDGVPTKAYTIVHLDQDKIEVTVKGNDPAQWEFRFSNSWHNHTIIVYLLYANANH